MVRKMLFAACIPLLGMTLLPVQALEPLATPAHITIHRFPSPVGIKLLVAPDVQDYKCRDDISGLQVSSGSTLRGPSPSVTCYPNPEGGQLCESVTAGGYHAVAGSGRMYVTSQCQVGSASATVVLQLPFNDPGVSHRETGVGLAPWSCFVNEAELTSNLGTTDWWVFCDLNIGANQPR